jgi:hypothetical protein
MYGIVTAGVLAARVAEQRSGCATTLEGRPATPRDLRRYAARLVAAVLVVRAAANVLGKHVLA